jgi:hypothetical protein
MNRFAAACCMLCTLVSSCFLFAQIADIRTSGDRIKVTDRSGNTFEVADPRMDPQSIRGSPDGRKLIYHMKFSYPPDPLGPLDLKLWSLARHNTLREISVPFRSRFVERVEWIDDRNVLIAGDSKGLIVDTELGGATHSLWARRLGSELFFISPDRKKIIYPKGMPRTIPPEFQSDVAMLAVVGKGLAATAEPLGLEAGVREVYPLESETNRGEIHARPPKERHSFLSGFLWSSGSSRVVFVERQEGILWLVGLTLSIDNSSVSARHERIELNQSSGVVEEFSWLTPDVELLLVIDGRRVAVRPLW